MLTLSIKKNNFSYLSFYNENNQIIINDYGFSSFKKKLFTKDDINQIKQRKRIKKSKIISRKCMIFLETDDIILNQMQYIDEISFSEFIKWQNELMFGKEKIDYFNDYHYKSCADNNILSIYINKNKQMRYLKDSTDSGMKLKVLSLGIFSAEYLARELFNGKDQKSYMVWAVGDDFDEIIIIKEGLFKSLIKFKRRNKTITPISYVGSQDYANDCFDKIKNNFPEKLKSIGITDKIYMYQKTPNTDMKKILKKNKDFVTVLNPLLKANFLKKSKVNQIESSYLSEMGYIFKTINND